MNILFISDKMAGGGAERVTATLASALCNDNNIYIVTHRKDAIYDIDDRVKIICLNIPKGTNFFNRIYHLVISVIRLRRIKRELNIECAISMLSGPNVRNVLSRRKEKVIISIRHKVSENTRPSSFDGKLNTFTCRHADKIVALSKTVELDEVEKFGAPKEKITTIYNPCDIDKIKEKANLKIENNKFVEIRNSTDFLAITAGRLVDQKGHWHMIRAFASVVKQHPDAKLVILGKGELEEELRILIYNLNVTNNIFLLGFDLNPYPYLKNSDLFLFSSLYEGFGNILLEAMACSLPILSCDCPAGPRELLSPNNITKKTVGIELADYGILTESFDGIKRDYAEELSRQERDFANAIELLMNKPKLRKQYKEMGSNRIQDFTVSSIIERWKGIF